MADASAAGTSPALTVSKVDPAAGTAAQPAKPRSSRDRFSFIDRFRGLVGVMMALGHSSGYFNGAWKTLDMFDPLFSGPGQFGLRYMGYLCAPGFLMMNGAVSWFSYTRRIVDGSSQWQAKWHIMQRGLFLILVQLTWVNAAWLAFRRMNFTHIGIISTIGISMCLLALFINWRWYVRLAIALLVLAVHPLLISIKYDAAIAWQRVLMQTFIDAGSFNKYPVLPWFALATMGSVMATGWFVSWKTPRARIAWSLAIGFAAIALAAFVRMGRGYGNLSPFDTLGSYSFFLDTKYPPSLFHNMWFFGSVCVMVGVIHLIGEAVPFLVRWLGAIGKVPLFFYCAHIAILSLVADRFGLYYRQGAVIASFVGWVALLVVMYPLAKWFGGVKARSKNKIIQLI
jgi:uncharacterized membrane protein